MIRRTQNNCRPQRDCDVGRFSRLNTATGYRDSLGVHVYVRDWQGNIRAVVRKGADGKTILEQATYYYPYGMPMAESTNPTVNKYKYTGKELLTDHGVNIMDYGARFYDPTACLWLSPDPHSADYAPISHYSMCAGDPINFVDPDGKDFFLFDQKGNLLNRTEIAEYDIVAMKIGEDKFEFGPMMDPNTLSIRETVSINHPETGQKVKADIIDIKGDDNGKIVHEFLSDKGSVEFTRLETGEIGGDNSLNVISTIHHESEEFGWTDAAKSLQKDGVNIRTMIHNHPSSSIDNLTTDIESRNKLQGHHSSFKDTKFKIYLKRDSEHSTPQYYDYTKRMRFKL